MRSEDWTNKVLNSLEGIERAKAPEGGFGTVKQKIADQKHDEESSKRLTMSVLIRLAAMITIILSINVWAISNYLEGGIESTDATTYSQITTDYNLYEDEY